MWQRMRPPCHRRAATGPPRTQRWSVRLEPQRLPDQCHLQRRSSSSLPTSALSKRCAHHPSHRPPAHRSAGSRSVQDPAAATARRAEDFNRHRRPIGGSLWPHCSVGRRIPRDDRHEADAVARLQTTGRSGQRSNRPSVVRPIRFHPPGSLEGIDRRLVAGNRHGAGGERVRCVGPPRHTTGADRARRCTESPARSPHETTCSDAMCATPPDRWSSSRRPRPPPGRTMGPAIADRHRITRAAPPRIAAGGERACTAGAVPRWRGRHLGRDGDEEATATSARSFGAV